MDDAEQALAYAEADFSEPNQRFLELFRPLAPAGPFEALDLGCGPADITLALARAYPRARVQGLDGAEAMLSFGRRALDAEPALAKRVELMCERLPSPRLPRARFDALLSNSLLHHLAEPQVLWQTVRDCARPGAAVLVMDLARPATPEAVDRVVAEYAADAPSVLRRDFRNSLFAAFTRDEVMEQLDLAGLQGLQVDSVSDRHLAVIGRLS
jgi:ubiquinone/menaquinone biosynthesis C-methylase UbiE